MKVKLKVADVVEYDVKFTLREGAKDKPFGMKLTANRLALEELSSALGAGGNVDEFLKARNLTMQAWIGESPLVDADTNQPIPPGPEALAAAMEHIPGCANLVYAGFLEANGARGRLGN